MPGVMQETVSTTDFDCGIPRSARNDGPPLSGDADLLREIGVIRVIRG